MKCWNPPDVHPPSVGEYRAALDPTSVDGDIRRWWSGGAWSNPYSINWGEPLKARIRSEASPCMVFWQTI